MKRSRNKIITILSTLFFFLSSPVQASDIEIFVEPPSPESLASILYKPRYRSVDGVKTKQANAFGMMVNFVYDSTRILADSLPMLDSVGEMLNLEKVKNQVLVIEGHTDARGAEYYNDDLSLRRANAVKLYLIASFDIQPERLVIIGRGESNLYDSSDPDAALNRRVEFKPQNNLVIE